MRIMKYISKVLNILFFSFLKNDNKQFELNIFYFYEILPFVACVAHIKFIIISATTSFHK